MEKETVKVYVDVDSLFDLRQGVLSQLMDFDSLLEYLKSDEYNFRDIDRFPVDMNEYTKILNEGRLTTIQNSVITYIADILTTKLFRLEKRNSFMGVSKAPEILLNMYPFNLTEEQEEVFRSALFKKLGIECYITIIYMDLKDLTPVFIKNTEIIGCFIYNITRWLDLHLEALNKQSMPELMIYGPALYKNKDEEKMKEIEKIKKLGFKDLFEYMEFLVMTLVSVNFLPTLFYNNILLAKPLIEKYSLELSKVSLAEEMGVKNGNIGAEV